MALKLIVAIMSLVFGTERFLAARKGFQTGVTRKGKVFANQYSSDPDKRGRAVSRETEPLLFYVLMWSWVLIAVCGYGAAIYAILSIFFPETFPFQSGRKG